MHTFCRVFVRKDPSKLGQTLHINYHRFSPHLNCNLSSLKHPTIVDNEETQSDPHQSSPSSYISKRIEKRLEKAKSERIKLEDSQKMPKQSKEIVQDFLKNNNDDFPLEVPVDFPSDSQKYLNWYRSQERKAHRLKVDPETTTCILFPGQGSQFVGMGKALLDYPNVKEMFEIANNILGYDLLKFCLNGPQQELNKTRICQPAVLVTSLAAVEKLKTDHLQVIENCISVAGFSVGEFAALVFSGAITFEDAIKLVKVRAEVMQAASEAIPSGMLSVFCTHKTNLSLAMEVSREVCKQKHGIKNPICHVANYLYPDCKVIAGHEQAIEFIAQNAKDFGIKRTKRLAVSGAFHTSLMQDGLPEFSNALKKVEFQPPAIPVFSNVKAERYSNSNQEFQKLLKLHLVKPVKWEQTMHVLYSRKKGENFPHTYEVGPGKHLGTLLRMVNLTAFQNYHKVEI